MANGILLIESLQLKCNLRITLLTYYKASRSCRMKILAPLFLDPSHNFVAAWAETDITAGAGSSSSRLLSSVVAEPSPV